MKASTVLKEDGRFEQLPDTKEQMNLLEEMIEDTEIELEYSKDQEAKIGHKSADTSFFGYKTNIAIDEETRLVTAATVMTGEKHDGKELPALVELTEDNDLEVEAVIGEGAYSEDDNLRYCEEKDIKNVSKLGKTVLYGNRSKKKRI